jgi:hypothetical protein
MLAALLFVQMYLLFEARRNYFQVMSRDRERIQQELLAAGVPPQQVPAILTAVRDMSDNAASLTSDVGWLMIFTTLFMMGVLAPGRSERGGTPDS